MMYFFKNKKKPHKDSAAFKKTRNPGKSRLQFSFLGDVWDVEVMATMQTLKALLATAFW